MVSTGMNKLHLQLGASHFGSSIYNLLYNKLMASVITCFSYQFVHLAAEMYC